MAWPWHANAIIDSKQHPARVYDLGTRLLSPCHNHVASILLDNTNDLHTTIDRAVDLLGQLRNVSDHLSCRRVVTIRTLLTEYILEAVASLRRVHLRVRIGIHGPDATNEEPLL